MGRKQWGHGFHAGRNSTTGAQSLVGKYLHTYADGVLHYQGEVLAALTDTTVLVQLFSFITGHETDQVVMGLDELKEAKFYRSADDMNAAYCDYEARQKRNRLAAV